jgi:hypothetical protein
MGGETSEPSSNISEQPDRQHRECREPSKAHHQKIAARQGKEPRVRTDDSNSQTPDRPSRATEERLRAEEKPSVQVNRQDKQPDSGQQDQAHFPDPSRQWARPDPRPDLRKLRTPPDLDLGPQNGWGKAIGKTCPTPPAVTARGHAVDVAGELNLDGAGHGGSVALEGEGQKARADPASVLTCSS